MVGIMFERNMKGLIEYYLHKMSLNIYPMVVVRSKSRQKLSRKYLTCHIIYHSFAEVYNFSQKLCRYLMYFLHHTYTFTANFESALLSKSGSCTMCYSVLFSSKHCLPNSFRSFRGTSGLLIM